MIGGDGTFHEIVTGLMFSRRRVTQPGDTHFSTGDIIENIQLVRANEKVEAEGKLPAKAEIVVKGISEVALSTKSWLSSASFQHTTRILVSAAVSGDVDDLRGLKENVIVGNLIPAGTGLREDFIELPEEEAIEEELCVTESQALTAASEALDGTTEAFENMCTAYGDAITCLSNAGEDVSELQEGYDELCGE